MPPSRRAAPKTNNAMIQANVLKGIQQVLGASGVDPKQDETVGQYVAGALQITEDQANRFLAALDRGSTTDDMEGEIDTANVNSDLLTR